MADMKDDLCGCPICGLQQRLCVQEKQLLDGRCEFQVVCLECGAQGPKTSTEDKARELWDEVAMAFHYALSIIGKEGPEYPMTKALIERLTTDLEIEESKTCKKSFKDIPLKKCPFCLRDGRLRINQHNTTCFVDCLECGAEGPYQSTLEDAAYAWNRLSRCTK